MSDDAAKVAYATYLDFLNSGDTPEAAQHKAGLDGKILVTPTEKHQVCGGWMITVLSPSDGTLSGVTFKKKCSKCKVVV